MNADIRNNAAISGTWNIDYFHGDNKIVKELVNGWQIAPILYLHSGGVFTMGTGSNKSFDSTGNQRPDYVAGQNPVLNPNRCRVCSPGPARRLRGSIRQLTLPTGPAWQAASAPAARTAT